MELKTVTIEGVTYAAVQDGKPVYLDGDKEVAFDAPHTVATISRLNGEAKGHRERADKAEGALRSFEGLDPDAARKALELASNLDQKKLIDAGEVEKVKAEIAKSWEGKLTEAEKRAQALEGQLYAEKIGGAFARSKFVTDNLILPPDIAETYFGRHFKVEDGQTVAYDGQGNRIYSRAKPGELADFEEALETIVSAYPRKEQILKGTGNNGGGANPGNGGGGGKTMKSAEFNALGPKERAAKMAEGVKLVD